MLCFQFGARLRSVVIPFYVMDGTVGWFQKPLRLQRYNKKMTYARAHVIFGVFILHECTMQENDRAVMQAYGLNLKTTESECVAELFKMYQELTK